MKSQSVDHGFVRIVKNQCMPMEQINDSGFFFLQSPMLQSGQNAVNTQLQKYAIQTTINHTLISGSN